MKKTYNILRIENLSYHQETDERIVWLVGELFFSIIFTCRDSGEIISRIRFKSRCYKAYSIKDVLRICIQNFLDKNMEDVGHDIYDTSCDCTRDLVNIHHLDVHLQEPFKSLFNDLFDNQKWEMPKALLA